MREKRLFLLMIVLAVISVLGLFLIPSWVGWNSIYGYFLGATLYIGIWGIITYLLKVKCNKKSNERQVSFCLSVHLFRYFYSFHVAVVISILWHLFLLFVWMFVLPYIILRLFNLWLGFNEALIVFIGILLGTILTTSYSKYMVKMVLWISPFIIPSHDKKKRLNNADYVLLITKLYSRKGIISIIYMLYFLYLVGQSYCHLQYQIPLISEELDQVILRSFIVYLGYINMSNSFNNI